MDNGQGAPRAKGEGRNFRAGFGYSRLFKNNNVLDLQKSGLETLKEILIEKKTHWLQR